MKDELQYILSGKSQVKHGAFIQTIASHLSGSQTLGTMAKDNQHHKAEETKELIHF